MPTPTPRQHHPAELAPSAPPRVLETQRVILTSGDVVVLDLVEDRDHYAVVERRGFGRDLVAAQRAFTARVCAFLLPEMACVGLVEADDAPTWVPPAPPCVATEAQS